MMRFKFLSFANLQAERLGSMVNRIPTTSSCLEPICKPVGSFFSAKNEGAIEFKKSKISETLRSIT